MKITRLHIIAMALLSTTFLYTGVSQSNASEGHGQDFAPAISSEEQVEASTNDSKHVEGLKWLEHTNSKYICMVNNKRFDRVQIPTEVDGKTYYGCCPMCKGKLEKIQSLRVAIDPVSGNVVDKATALIGSAPDGTAYYFENEENMKKFDELKSKE